MKKSALFFIMLFSVTVLANDLPKIAVYVTGDFPDNEKNALGTRMLASLVNSGRYMGIERSGTFLAEIEKEQIRQRSGEIDDGQISELGKQFGVKFVCIADITPVLGAYQVSARIVNVETAAIVAIGEHYSNLKTVIDLVQVANEVVKKMFGGRTEPESEEKQTASTPEEFVSAEPDAAASRAAAIPLVRPLFLDVTNPAFINENDCMSLHFLFFNTLQEGYMHEAAFILPLGLYDAIGLSWMMQGASEYEPTDAEGNPYEGKKIADQSHFFALTYARNVWGPLTVGGNINVITSSNFGNTRLGFGADIGLSYKFLRHPTLGNHVLGVSTENIFNVMLDTDERYPAALRFSLLSDFWERRISLGLDFVAEDIFSESIDWNPGVANPFDWTFTQMLGCDIARIVKLYLLTGFNSYGFDHYGFALTATIPKFLKVNGVEVGLQFQEFVSGEASASRITMFARAGFGRSRADRLK